MIQEKGVISRIHRFRPALVNLSLELPGIARLAKPGQFVHLRINGLPGILLRRPFSIAGVEDCEVNLLIKIVGAGTAGLANFKEGQTCDVIGPLGEGFTYDGAETAYLVGGGIGVAPLLFLQTSLLKKKVNMRFFLGARTHKEFTLEDEVVTIRSIVHCTDDGSYGQHGLVTKFFEEHVSRDVQEKAEVYSCGPIPMMREIARICDKYGLSYQVSLENHMGCGIGVCQGCALRLAEDGDRGGFRLVCCDGPVFDASQLDWSLIEPL